jgi:hypothetical protein
MASLNTNDKHVLEKLFQMNSGYVLNFGDRSMAEFFRDDVGVDIFNPKYNYASGSKANRIRGFWQVADNALVGKSIGKLIEYIDNQILLGHLNRDNFPAELVQRARSIAARLQGIRVQATALPVTEDEFINREFKNVSIDKLGLDDAITAILKRRIDEIRKTLNVHAPLAAIFLCGSALEGILLGIACTNSREF